MRINANTKLCLVIASPIGHTLSPQIHNAGYEQIGIDNKYVCTASEVAPEHLADFVKGARTMKGLCGIICTIPHKSTIIPLLDEVDKVAEVVGAVNTIIRSDDGRLTGYNTDWVGFLAPLKQVTRLDGKKAALIGAGGVARAITYALTQNEVRVTIYDREEGKAEVLAREFGCDSANLKDLSAVKSAEIVVNATPVGMHPNEDTTPIPKEHLHSGQIVYDAVYNPLETRLLRDATAAGAKVIHGYEMFLRVAEPQFEKFTGEKAPIEAMQSALIQALGANPT